jgi:hypothetical protein
MGASALVKVPAIVQPERPIVVEVATWLSVIERFGIWIMTTDPGENPSFWFWYFGFMWTPDLFIGVAIGFTLTSSPVGVAADFVNALFGHGSRQLWPDGVVTKASHIATDGDGIT